MSAELGRLAALARPERGRLVAAALLSVLTVASGVLLMSTSAWLLSKAALHPSIAALQVAIVGVRAFGISRATLRYLERLGSHDVTLRLLARLRTAVYRGLVPLAPARLVGHRRGDLLGRLLDDVSTLEAFYARLLGPTLAAVGTAALVAALLWAFDAALPPVALAGLLAAGLLLPAAAAKAGEASGRRLVAARARLSARAVDGVHGVADLLAFGAEEAHARALRDDALAATAEQARLARASALGTAAATVATDLTAVAVLATAVPAVSAGRLDGVSLATVVLATVAAFEAVAPLSQASHGLGAMRAAAARVFALLDEPPAVSEPVGPAPAPIDDAPPVEVRGLRFAYPGETRPALAGIDLRLERGRRVAVVGASGSGKSTLVNLLLRFLEAPPGTVFLDGHDLLRWPSDTARERFAVAAQDARVFTGTLRDNLRLARPGAGDDVLREALARVSLEPERLPQGLDTAVGEEGRRLSGGERQRLALARALLRPAPVLLLDEPTAHLDALTEREVLRELVRAGEGRATLLVTHRLVGLADFDEVVVLDGGHVVERGTAADLEARGGAFARLLARQRAAEALGDPAFAAVDAAPPTDPAAPAAL